MKPTSILLATLFSAVGLQAAPLESATLKIQADVKLELRAGPHAIDDVDRNRYFRTYHIPGMFSDAEAAWMQELRISPGRGTGPYLGHNGGDDQRAGWDPVLEKQFEQYAQFYKKAESAIRGRFIHSPEGTILSFNLKRHSTKALRSTRRWPRIIVRACIPTTLMPVWI